MNEKTGTSRWRAFGASTRGAAHVRAGQRNQDAIRWSPPAGAGPPLVLAVADGHGSARHIRSRLGARLAVRVATDLLHEFGECWSGQTTLSTVKRTAEERLPRALVGAWRAAVCRDLDAHPLTVEALGGLAQRGGARVRQTVEVQPVLAYGTTVLAVLVTEAFILALQLGDGDILAVSESGDVCRALPADERLFANQTTSLCGEEPWRDVRVGFAAVSPRPPALMLLATDGYANSFRDDHGFLQVGADLLALLRAEGADTVRRSLRTWLADASLLGSGDDITLGLLCRIDAIQGGTRAVGAAPVPVDTEPALWAEDVQAVALGDPDQAPLPEGLTASWSGS